MTASANAGAVFACLCIGIVRETMRAILVFVVGKDP